VLAQPEMDRRLSVSASGRNQWTLSGCGIEQWAARLTLCKAVIYTFPHHKH
jgi:hypothetical protein